MPDPIRFYLDEHIHPGVARALRGLGIDVVTVAECGMLGGSDEEHLARATAERRVVASMDSDFAPLGAITPQHCGVVYLNRSRDVGMIVRRLAYLHMVLKADDLASRVEFL